MKKKRCWICGRTTTEIKQDAKEFAGSQSLIYPEITTYCGAEIQVCLVCKGLIENLSSNDPD